MVVDGSRMMLAAPRSVNASPTSAQIERVDAMVDQLDRDDGQRLFGLARRSGPSDDDADDAVQEALLRLWLEVRSGVEIIEPRTWTFRTLYRVAMDRHRVRRRASDVLARVQVPDAGGRTAAGIAPPHGVHCGVWRLIRAHGRAVFADSVDR